MTRPRFARHARALLTLLAGACAADETIVSTPCDACGGDCVVESLPDRGSDHVDGAVDYPESPPASGDHHACWATWGLHDDVVAPEQWVHNLEHGGVVSLYQCTNCVEELSALAVFVSVQPPGRSLLTAYDAPMEQPFAVVSWRHRLLLGCVDTGAMQRFFDENVANAPEDVTADPGCVE